MIPKAVLSGKRIRAASSGRCTASQAWKAAFAFELNSNSIPAYRSSVFSRNTTMSTASGCLTGEGTPGIQRTGRTQAYRSSRWRSATFSDRIPPPTGVANGPLIAARYLAIACTVSSGRACPTWAWAFSPAGTDIQPSRRAPP